jgi:hypothetical protein
MLPGIIKNKGVFFVKPITFISHKYEDTASAVSIKNRLEIYHQIECYLDAIDENSKNGPDLADYLKGKLRDCNNLIVAVSSNTKSSWWVPWEIGVASEREYPHATFSIQNTDLPSYLKKWPYLKDMNDLDQYARTAKETFLRLAGTNFLTEAVNLRKSASQDFFSVLRSRLGQ